MLENAAKAIKSLEKKLAAAQKKKESLVREDFV